MGYFESSALESPPVIAVRRSGDVETLRAQDSREATPSHANTYRRVK